MEYKESEFLEPDENLLSLYEKSLEEIQKTEHYLRILLWIFEKNVHRYYKDSLKDLEEMWCQRKQKFGELKKADYEKHLNSLNEDFLYKNPSFFIHLVLVKYPCSFDELLVSLKNEDIFIMNLVVFYILNDLLYVNSDLKKNLEELRQNFTNVITKF